ncbi:MAG TPA: hypothetical protein DCR44_00150 [Acholeplasmatales bacterium]|nr:MAG: hypothetical protein A2Y16_01580 [Tenericutes bacterium GWF2_57_13]HAQ55815.1 hypothetical protein [Acholeplasmatales bacterium]
MFSLKNVAIFVDHMEFTDHHHPSNQYKLSPSLSRNIEKIENAKYHTSISIIFGNKSPDSGPFYLHAIIKGVFEFNEIETEEEVMKFMKLQAVHILYPYLRSLVTNIMTTALKTPLVLPVIDASRLFPEDRN